MWRRMRLSIRPPVPAGATPDPDHDYLVGLALLTEADASVSGDRDLLDAADLWPPAMSPRALLDRLPPR